MKQGIGVDILFRKKMPPTRGHDLKQKSLGRTKEQ